MALATGAPVIPVAVAGTQYVKPLGTPWWKWGWRKHCVFVIGEPITPPVLINPTSEQRKAFTARVMESIALLKEQADAVLAAK